MDLPSRCKANRSTTLSLGFPPTWGDLTVYNTSGNIGDQQWGNTLTTGTDANLCNQINFIETAEDDYSTHQVRYNPFGPNSNSLVHWLLSMGYLGNYFSAPPKTTGWNSPLYGQ